MLKSSIYREQSVPGLMQLTVLLFFMIKRVADKMLPWGTPCSCLNTSDRVVPTLTRKPLPLTKFSIKMGSFPELPIHASPALFHTSMLCNICLFKVEKHRHRMFFSDKTLSDKCFQPDQVVKCTTFFPEATLKACD